MRRFFEWTTAVFFALMVLFLGFPQARTLVRVMLAIIFEAFPFMLLGAFISGLIEVYVSREKMNRLLPSNPLRAVMVAGFLGVFFPVCECAIIPIIRRLVKKGAPVSVAVTYMLAAPIVNPIVFVSTLTAFSYYGNVTDGKLTGMDMALSRTVIGYVIACVVGMLVWRFFRKGSLKECVFEEGTVETLLKQEQCSCKGHCDGHAHHEHQRQGHLLKIRAAILHASQDFAETARYVVIAAAVAVLLRYSISPENLSDTTLGDLTQISGMMLLAAVMNLCSEADAFVAFSLSQFTSLVPGVKPAVNLPAAVMSFMVLGPMFDLKLLAMYGTVFKKRLIVFIPVAVVLLTFIASVLFNLVFGGA